MMGIAIGLLVVAVFLVLFPVLCWKFIGPRPDDDAPHRLRGCLRFFYAMIGLGSALTLDWWWPGESVTLPFIPMVIGGFVIGVITGDFCGWLMQAYWPAEEED
jgi:hypothetical protein